VITGSVAYDYLMTFPGRFQDHILPEKLHVLSVSFLVDAMRRQRGGCATNIAYSLALLGERPQVMATVGQDFSDYRAALDAVGVDTSLIHVVEDDFTASFFVSTDRDNNQIASFYPGAMAHAGRLSFHHLDRQRVTMAVISPNDPAAMNQYVRECTELGIPYLYDPSQQIIRLSGEDLLAGARGAQILIVNEYEFGMIQNKTGLSESELLQLTPVVIVTQGENGSTIFTGGRAIPVPVCPPERIVDPTGVGDAYRAGLLKGLVRGYDWPVTGRIASLAAAYVLEQVGTQSHRYTRPQFVARYRAVFGDTPELQDLLK